MSSPIDLYVEKILARMVVDDAQRVEIERELRNHLEEAVADAEARGLSREQATQEVIRAFGHPALLARQFHTWPIVAGHYFEKTALAGILLFYWFYCAHMLGFLIGPLPGYVAVLGLLAFVQFLEYWPRIEVNGGLRVRRLFRPALAIPFEAIEAVRLEKWHLFGRRRLWIKYAGRLVLLSTRLRGMRVAGVALETLVGDRVDEPVKAHLRRLRLRIRKERPRLKWVMTAVWAALALLAAHDVSLLWQGYAIPSTLPFAIGFSVIALIVQGVLQRDRFRRGMCWLLILGFVTTGAFLFNRIGVGNLDSARAALFIYAVLMFLAALTLWWRGRRVHLFGFAVALWMIALVVGQALPSFWGGSTRIVARSGHMPQWCRWFQNGQRMAWLSHEPRGRTSKTLFEAWKRMKNPEAAVLYVAGLDGEQLRHPLPGKAGEWDMFPQRSDGELLLLRSFEENHLYGSAIYAYDTIEGVKRLPFVPHATHFALMRNWGNPWSPDGRYLVMKVPKNRDDFSKGSRLVVLEIDTGTTIGFGDDVGLGHIRWTSDIEFQVVGRHVVRDGDEWDSPVLERSIRIWSYNAAPAERTLAREYPLRTSESARILDGVQYAAVETEYWDGATTPPPWVSILNLETGTSIPIKGLLTADEKFTWNARCRKLAYLSVYVSDAGDRWLVLADADRGIEAKVRVPGDPEYLALRLSPDGKHLLFYRFLYTRRNAFGGGTFSGPIRVEVWDIESGRIVPVGIISGLGGTVAVMQALYSAGPFELPTWSPDGRYIIYSSFRWPARSITFEIKAADWGGWLAGRE